MQARGESTGMQSQADIVDSYGLRLNDELDYENVRTHYIDTRKAPVRTEEERLKEVPDGFVPIFVSCDWHGRKRDTNSSTVEFAGEYFRLADALCFAMSEWGKCTAFGHRVSKPIVLEADKGFIRIKPFALNGPNADQYIRRLDKLGEDLGRAIGEYLTILGQGLRR